MSERENPQGQGGATAVAPAPQQAAPPQAPAAPIAPAPAPQAPNSRRLFLINGIGLLILIIIVGGGYYLWHQSYYFYSTDDATVSGTLAAAAPPAPGSVTAVDYGLGATVSKGATIATLRTASGGTVNVVSPISGTIVQEGATPGEVLPAGQPLAQVVDLSGLTVTAYVEETHIKDVQTGQGVDVTVDAVTGTTFHGAVTRILPAAASTLSALPSADYASGNFTKVTQRIPVQITLDGYQGQALYPGESATVTIHIHN